MAPVVRPKPTLGEVRVLEWITSPARFGRVGFVESSAQDLSVSGRTGYFKSYTKRHHYAYSHGKYRNPTTGMNFVECFICGTKCREPDAIVVLQLRPKPGSFFHHSYMNYYYVFECCRNKMNLF